MRLSRCQSLITRLSNAITANTRGVRTAKDRRIVYVTETKKRRPIWEAVYCPAWLFEKLWHNKYKNFFIHYALLINLVYCYQIFYSERPEPVRLNVEISYHFRRFLAGSLD